MYKRIEGRSDFLDPPVDTTEARRATASGGQIDPPWTRKLEIRK
jgi:hypothetical protein